MKWVLLHILNKGIRLNAPSTRLWAAETWCAVLQTSHPGCHMISVCYSWSVDHISRWPERQSLRWPNGSRWPRQQSSLPAPGLYSGADVTGWGTRWRCHSAGRGSRSAWRSSLLESPSSFFSRAVRAWNRLPPSARNASSLPVFKKCIADVF